MCTLPMQVEFFGGSKVTVRKTVKAKRSLSNNFNVNGQLTNKEIQIGPDESVVSKEHPELENVSTT